MRVRTIVFGGALLFASLLALFFGSHFLLIANIAYVAALASVVFVVADDLIDPLFRCLQHRDEKPGSVKA